MFWKGVRLRRKLPHLLARHVRKKITALKTANSDGLIVDLATTAAQF